MADTAGTYVVSSCPPDGRAASRSGEVAPGTAAPRTYDDCASGTRTFETNRYRFRAVVHADPGFPFAAGKSNVVKVLVRP